MKRSIAILAAAAALIASCTPKAQEEHRVISIIPEPEHIQLAEGSFTAGPSLMIHLDEDTPEMQRVAGFLTEKLSTAAGIKAGFTEETDRPGTVYFMNAGLPEECYELRVEPERIVIDYGTPSGAFYAIQSLLQLFPQEIFETKPVKGVKWSVPCVSIEDRPRFPYRGMHLDCCLHFFEMDFLKKYIDIMALHKVNRFHWHLTEDQGWRLEIKKYPLLTEKGQWRKETVVGSLYSGIYDGKPHGGYYTQEEVKELVKYAAERYVTIVPEIEMPGHALAAIACYPELSCGLEDHYETATKWGIFKQVYCPKEETFKFLEDVLEEVFELFPSEYIHIGGDECPKTSWKQCAHKERAPER